MRKNKEQIGMIDIEKIEKTLKDMSFDDTLQIAEELGFLDEWLDPVYDDDPEELQEDAALHIMNTLKLVNATLTGTQADINPYPTKNRKEVSHA